LIEVIISVVTSVIVVTAFTFQYFAPKSEVTKLQDKGNAQAIKIAKLEAQMESVNKLLEKLATDSEQHGLALVKILSILEGMTGKHSDS